MLQAHYIFHVTSAYKDFADSTIAVVFNGDTVDAYFRWSNIPQNIRDTM